MTRIVPTGRTTGLLLPLFSMPSSRSWGIGEILDLIPMAAWAREAGLGFLQLLPINEMAAGQTSPYSATSAMAIDPIFISLHAVQDFVALGGEPRLDLGDQIAIRAARTSSRVEYTAIRRAKQNALRMAFELLLGYGVGARYRPGRIVRRVLRVGRVLARRLRTVPGPVGHDSTTDPGSTGRPNIACVIPRRSSSRARISKPRSCSINTCSGSRTTSGKTARERSAPVALFGDFPFMVSTDSADVWARQHLFRSTGRSVFHRTRSARRGRTGACPSIDGTRWQRTTSSGCAIVCAAPSKLFDGYRIDHVVGFYRMYSRPIGHKQGLFDPAEEPAQLAQGERLMSIFLKAPHGW